MHRYFLNAHLKLWPDVERILQDLKYKEYRCVFTGHSLGGALATLGAARTVRQGWFFIKFRREIFRFSEWRSSKAFNFRTA